MRRKITGVYRWKEIFVCAVIGFGPLSFADVCSAQTSPLRFSIDAAQIVDAMRAGALPVDGVQVRLAAPVTSSVPAARIEIQSAVPVDARQLRLRLACSGSGECLPFLATVTYPNAVGLEEFHRGEIGVKAVAAVDRDSERASVEANASRTAKIEFAPQEGMLRAGTKTTLEFEADRIHVRLEVISLQNAVPGDRVRVSSLDHKQIYTAQVVSPTLLKGELSK